MSYAVEQDDTEDRYYTQVEAGDVRLFTLDQLDAAFNAGLIHENTYVCLEGGSEWLTLAEVAGLGDEQPDPEPISVVAPVPQRVAPAAYPPVVASLPYSATPSVTPNTIRPVVNDLSFDDLDSDMMAMRPKRRIGKVVAGVAVVALGALGFAVVQSGGIKLPKMGSGVGQASAASLTHSTVTEAKPTPKVEAPAPEPAKPEPTKVEDAKPAEPASADTKPASDTAAEKKGDDRFSEDMKAALLNKDKQQAVDQKRKKSARGAVAARKPAKATKAAGSFKSGGSAYDPLNGKL